MEYNLYSLFPTPDSDSSSDDEEEEEEEELNSVPEVRKEKEIKKERVEKEEVEKEEEVNEKEEEEEEKKREKKEKILKEFSEENGRELEISSVDRFDFFKRKVENPQVTRTNSYNSWSEQLQLNPFLISGVTNGNETPILPMDQKSEELLSCSTPGDTTHRLIERKLLVVMVGLPVCGKSYAAWKLCRYLNWMGYVSKHINIDAYRRKENPAFQSASFFANDNRKSLKLRERCAMAALEDSLKFLDDGGKVAILDGTNTTFSRRQKFIDFAESYRHENFSLKILFLEVICQSEVVIEKNILAAVQSPLYNSGLSEEEASKDMKERIKHYQETYQEVGVQEQQLGIAFIKAIDSGTKIVTHKISGFLLSRILIFSVNLHSLPRPIYLCRHGESEYNVLGLLGGNPPLTSKGLKYSAKLAEFMQKELDVSGMNLWTSTMTRTIQSAAHLRGTCAQYVKWKALDEIDVGICDGMTYKEIETRYKDEFEQRAQDKLRYCYPRGESYEDVVRRVEPVIIEAERTRRPVLIICHRAVLRCLYAYLTDNCTKEEMPNLDIPLHTIFKITPHAYGTKVEKFKVDIGGE